MKYVKITRRYGLTKVNQFLKEIGKNFVSVHPVEDFDLEGNKGYEITHWIENEIPSAKIRKDNEE